MIDCCFDELFVIILLTACSRIHTTHMLVAVMRRRASFLRVGIPRGGPGVCNGRGGALFLYLLVMLTFKATRFKAKASMSNQKPKRLAVTRLS